MKQVRTSLQYALGRRVTKGYTENAHRVIKVKLNTIKTLGPAYQDTVFNQLLAPVNLNTNSNMKTNLNRAGTITHQVYLNRQIVVRLVTCLEINNIRKQITYS
jgi:hypothetical protein